MKIFAQGYYLGRERLYARPTISTGKDYTPGLLSYKDYTPGVLSHEDYQPCLTSRQEKIIAQGYYLVKIMSQAQHLGNKIVSKACYLI